MRSDARRIVKVASAKLLDHHGDHLPGMAPRSERSGDSSWEPLVGPKTPYWECKECDFEENFACREKCKGCKARAPAKVRAAAARNAKNARVPRETKPSQPRGEWTAGAKQEREYRNTLYRDRRSESRGRGRRSESRGRSASRSRGESRRRRPTPGRPKKEERM